jgi:hypothetical protein
MPVYILAGPAVALIGLLSIFFVMRRRAVDKRSMYSSRRSQIERKVRAARQRTLAPHGRGDKPPTAEEIAAAAPMTSTPAYQAPAYQAPAYQAPAPSPPQAWEMGASPAAPAYQAPAPAPAYPPPAPVPTYEPPASEPAAPSAPEAEPVWNPAPAEAVWTPAPAADFMPAAPAAEPAPAPAEEPLTPAGGGASWSIVGADVPGSPPEAPAKGKAKDKKKDKAKEPVAAGSGWQLSSGEAPTEGADEGDEEAKRPSATMAIAQYAVLVVGLVMVLIGVLVMVANSKVT